MPARTAAPPYRRPRRLTREVSTTERTAGVALARALSALVAVAAGIVGVAMLVAPGATGEYFSWNLGSEPLAAIIGACYVASAAVFGWAAVCAPWPALRPLCIAVFGLSVPTLLATSQHLAVFDFTRWQALAWIGLFLGSVAFFGLTLAITRAPVTSGATAVSDGGRVALAVVAACYVLTAASLWFRPDTVAAFGPIDAGPLGLRFAGSWAAFLALLAIAVVIRPALSEARVALVALVLWPALVAVVVVLRVSEFRVGLPTVVLLGSLGVLLVVPAFVLVATLRRRVRTDQVRAASINAPSVAVTSVVAAVG